MRVVAAAVSALVLAGALVGCSGDEREPSTLPPLPSAEPSAGTAVTPGPTPAISGGSAAPGGEPAIPAAAIPATSDGATAFASYYLGLVGQAFAEADPAPLRGLSGPQCEGCQAIIEAVETLGPQGHRRVGGEYLIREAVAPPVVDGDVVVLVTYERAPGGIVNASGAVIESAPAVPRTNAQMRLLRRGSSWYVQGYRVV